MSDPHWHAPDCAWPEGTFHDDPDCPLTREAEARELQALRRLKEYATHREDCNVYSDNVAQTGCECSCGFDEAWRAVQ